MNLSAVRVVPFNPAHQPGIDRLFHAIQAEFSQPVFESNAATITELSNLEERKFWVAQSGELLVGTAGIILLDSKCCALKSMFVAKDFRGAKYNVGASLLRATIKWAQKFGCLEMYLGTMKQFAAAQKFYEKHDFERISKVNLPPDFPANTMDTVFYRKVL